MALDISDISLLEDNMVEAELEPRDVGEECTSTKKRKRIEEENNDSITTSTVTANVSTLWSQLDQQDVAEISEGLEDPKIVQEAAGVNPQATWQKQNSGIYNPLKVHFSKCEVLLNILLLLFYKYSMNCNYNF